MCPARSNGVFVIAFCVVCVVALRILQPLFFCAVLFQFSVGRSFLCRSGIFCMQFFPFNCFFCNMDLGFYVWFWMNRMIESKISRSFALFKTFWLIYSRTDRAFQSQLVSGCFSRVDKKREEGFSACLVSTEERGPSILPIETTTLL